jgi:hypothetical protein
VVVDATAAASFRSAPVGAAASLGATPPTSEEAAATSGVGDGSGEAAPVAGAARTGDVVRSRSANAVTSRSAQQRGVRPCVSERAGAVSECLQRSHQA